MRQFTYTYLAIFTLKHKEIIVEFPDFPRAKTSGDSYEDALSMARESLEFQIFDLEDEGISLPKPSQLCDISVYKNQFIFPVKAYMNLVH